MELLTKEINNLKQNNNVIEAIQTISELAILGDKKEQDLFDIFIEERVLDEFAKILRQSKDTNTINAILSSIGMLITNLNKNIVVLLSHPQLNEFIIYNSELSNEETQEYYINFIKMLSLKITKQNINLFFNQKYNFFPLLLYSQNFYNSTDSLTRTTTHNILLGILKNIPDSPMENELKCFLQSYPFLQVMINHVSYMKELLQKWSNDQGKYREHLLDLHYFFTDLYSIADYLIDILDNLFMHLIIVPLYQNLSKSDAKVQTQTLMIIHNLFEIKFSQRLLTGIFTLIFSSKVPIIPQFQIETNYIPTKDPELINICKTFFSVPEQVPIGIFQSITQSIVSVPSIFYKEIPKMTAYKSFIQFDLINRLNLYQLYKENILNSDQYSYNQYNIYAILNSLNEQHFSLILSLMESILQSPQFYPISEGERYTNIINLLSIVMDGGQQNLNTIHNCQKAVPIIFTMLTESDKDFFVTFTRSILLKRIEEHLQGATINYYRYFLKIFQSIQENNIQIFNNICECHQILRYLLILNINFEKKWLACPFQEQQFPSNRGEISFNNDKIQLTNKEIKTENLVFQLNEWVQFQEKEQYLQLTHIINKQEKLELQFWDSSECKKCIQEIYDRQTDQEQHSIPQIITQLHKLYQ